MSKEITDANFSKEIEKSGKPALLDFGAIWCGPCKMMSHIIDELSIEYDGKIIVGKIDVDENPVLSTQFKIKSIPTLLLINEKGDVVEIVVGVRPKSDIAKKMELLLSPND
ncbi:MAG: thioredoxin [bacterium]|nr:thioredoxin [bacterium]